MLSLSSHYVYLTDVSNFSKTAASDMTKAARAKFESRRTSRLSRSTEALPSSAAEASASDMQFRRRTSLQLKLFSSARRASRSHRQSDASQTAQQETAAGRGRRSKRRPHSQYQSAVVNVTDERSASSDTSHDASSSTDPQSAQTSRRQPLMGLQSTDSSSLQSEAPRLTETLNLHTDSRLASQMSTVSLTRQYRAPDVTMQMPFSSVTGRNVQISDDCRTACRQPGDFCNAYVFTQRPLLPGEELVIRITGTSVDYMGGITVGLTSCDPTTLQVTDLPDDADKLLDRPEYWVVHKNICKHPKVNDELAFLRTVSGKF